MDKADATARTTPDEPTAAERAARRARADTLVRDHMLMSLGAGLIPVPLVDLGAGVAVQVALLKRLCTLYGVPFSEAAARGIAASVLGGVGAGAIATGLFASGVKLIPGAGTLFGVTALPVALSAVTYALGTLFIAHLELGGILRDFRPAGDPAYFKDLVRRGKETAAGLTPSAGREPARS
jgi:uncharacterized protein (DUF697 family)